MENKWQPIETAPFDVPMLLWVADAGENGEIATGHCYKSIIDERRPKAKGYGGFWTITHWMPLPTPPQGEPK